MKKTIYLLLICCVCSFNSFAQGNKNSSSAPIVELLNYRAGTDTKLARAKSAFRKGDYAVAIEAAKDTLAHEPTCMEAAWILALSHDARKELGGMIEALAFLAIREASESQYAQEIVYKGSKGYVLSSADRTVKIDYGENDRTQTGASFVVYSEGEALQHPVTFQILYVERRLIAEVEITSVFGSHSVAEVVKSYGRIEPGMRVVPKTEYDDILESAVTSP